MDSTRPDGVPAGGGWPDRFRTVALALGVGAVTWAWSEGGYWARFKPGDRVGDWLPTYVVYVAFAYLCLVIVRRSRVATVPGLFLAGACFGWIEEGAYTGTTFADLPISLVWTALAWHATITVLIGWWWLPHRLVAGTRPGLLACGLTGLVWGLWAVSWWGPRSKFWDIKAAIAPNVPRFAAFAVLIVAVTAVAYTVWHRLPTRSGQLRGRVLPLLLAVAFLAWFGVLIVPRIPFAPLLLAPLLAMPAWALRRHARHTTEMSLLETARWGVPPGRLAPLAAVPAVATAVYAAWLPLAGTSVPRALHGVIPLSLSAAAVVIFVRSMRAARNAGRPAPAR